jgi:multiple sugar transport system substrate-binding protein
MGIKETGGLNRREALAGLAALAAAMATASGRSAFAQEARTIKWWDHFQPIAPLFEKAWADYGAAHPGVSVEHTIMNPADMMQALQLAFRSEQSPDVMSIPAPLATLNQLASSSWFAPAGSGLHLDKPFQKDVLFEGLTNFGGKVYSFPLFTFRQHSTALWSLKDKIDTDGNAIKGWDQIRQVAKAATRNGVYGLLLPIQFTDRMRVHVDDLSQMIGGAGPIDWKTGQYNYAADEYVETLKQLLSFQQDGTLHPASSSLDARQGRTRWAAGEAAMFTDGPWNSGVIANSFAQVLPNVAVSGNPVLSDNGHVHATPQAGTFWISAQSKNPDIASELLNLFTTNDFYIKLAERMDQPPLDLDAVAKANVDQTYKDVVAGYKDSVRLAPEPVIRNADVGKVYAEMKPISPNLGEIVQGAFAGAFSDPKPVLQQLSDQMTAERDRAIKAVNDAGGKVSVDDWKFDNWNPAEDFTPDKY